MTTHDSAGLEFSDVDGTINAKQFLAKLDQINAVDFVQFVKRRIVERLDVHTGGRYLDVGCGTGEDVRSLASRVGQTGQAVGIDASEAMIAEATQRAIGSGLPVVFQKADAHQLPFADGTFDGCRVERVLQHLTDPQQTVLEMARVTRSGGRVVAFEPDWGMFYVDAEDRGVTRAVLNQLCDGMRNGWMGRQLPRLFEQAMLNDVKVEPMTSTQSDFARWRALFDIDSYARRAQEAGLVTAGAVAAWLAQLEHANTRGAFLAGGTSFLVSAHKP